MKDQQEAERKKVASQEIQQALDEQTKVITAKQANVREDLAGVEPAVIEAQQGTANEIFVLKLTLSVIFHSTKIVHILSVCI